MPADRPAPHITQRIDEQLVFPQDLGISKHMTLLP